MPVSKTEKQSLAPVMPTKYSLDQSNNSSSMRNGPGGGVSLHHKFYSSNRQANTDSNSSATIMSKSQSMNLNKLAGFQPQNTLGGGAGARERDESGSAIRANPDDSSYYNVNHNH